MQQLLGKNLEQDWNEHSLYKSQIGHKEESVSIPLFIVLISCHHSLFIFICMLRFSLLTIKIESKIRNALLFFSYF